MVAFCPMNNEIHIASFEGGAFKVLHVLKEHDQRVTAIDWGAAKNRIVSCAEDRNAYVWDLKDGLWVPTLAVLRINRAATYCKWSPNEEKFAVASGQKCLAVCYYEAENNWWISKLVDGFESSVLTVAWHPSNVVIAAGSTDCTVRMFCAAIKGVDKKPPELFGPDAPMKKIGDLICTIPSKGWVHDVAFSSSGSVLAFTTHDSAVHFVLCQEGQVPGSGGVETVRASGLPHVRMLFLSEDCVVCGGHDNNPTVFARKGGRWAEGRRLDDEKSAKGQGQGASARNAAFNKFEMASQQGLGEGSGGGSSLNTLHQNCISGLATCQAWAPGGQCAKFSSVGLDGRLCFWKVPKLEELFSALAV
uniref:Arp2/3 complex 41 kDa subunit n=2 Tax=Hemiselmis andersenii TaxID=464988 RepID=A0A7S1H133_HEMAN